MMKYFYLIFFSIGILSCDTFPFNGKNKNQNEKNYQLSVLLCYLPIPKLATTNPNVRYSNDPNLLSATFPENSSMEYPQSNFAVSTDRGFTWKFFNISEKIRDYTILSSEKYYLITNENVIFTLDAGQNWSKRPHNIYLPENQIISLFSARENSRLILLLKKTNSVHVFVSVNDGLTWEQSILNGNLLYDETFQYNKSRILTATNNPNGTISKFYLYESTELGDQYNILFEKSLNASNANQVAPTRIFFENQNTGYLSGNSLIYKTTNSGTDWTEISMTTRGSVFYSEGNSLYYASRNNIQKSDDAGTSWYRLKSNFVITKFFNLNSFYGRESNKNYDLYYASFSSEGTSLPTLELKNWNGFTYWNSEFASCRKNEEAVPVNMGDL